MDLTAGVQTYEIRSMSGRDLVYIVRQNAAGEWSCSCPHFTYRMGPLGGHCKHIKAVQEEACRTQLARWHWMRGPRPATP